ncbi:DUF952 domain-containing protein [Nakamurella aerolata]|uniref:DUF952 domain-containing protein n=1 Tax=Nakamurella aerolata TaxID=1656892 RepID=UPI0031B604B6
MSDDRYLYHYTVESDWEAATAAGEYRVSGRGLTLDGEGFIHFCYAGQRPGVWQRFWADIDLAAEPVVLLTVDPDDLDPQLLKDENTSGGTELFPHLYGPLPVEAVTAVHAVDAAGNPV